ncbi:hypothetical protein [Bacillus sp. AG1]|uniref:hypothetical protein n=1 Tax=Bacillus sp. AG1 TaxID=480127 RepID=UPI002AB557E6|nr:hypothetical protein [Bacillus sp. AG1]MDY7906752.1 hypothetical protein [Bacillus sp. AG1]
MIEFANPIPMKKTCTMHPESKSVRSLSFTDFNDNSVTLALCSSCLTELDLKSGFEMKKIYRGKTGCFPEVDRVKKGDYVYLTRVRRVAKLEMNEDLEAAKNGGNFRLATSEEIEEYKKKLGEEA